MLTLLVGTNYLGKRKRLAVMLILFNKFNGTSANMLKSNGGWFVFLRLTDLTEPADNDRELSQVWREEK